MSDMSDDSAMSDDGTYGGDDMSERWVEYGNGGFIAAESSWLDEQIRADLAAEVETLHAENERLKDALTTWFKRDLKGLRDEPEVAALRAATMKLHDAVTPVMLAIIAVKPLLDRPYPDHPGWTPWTRWVEAKFRVASQAMDVARKAAAGQETI